MTFHCVGYAGVYHFPPEQPLQWKPMHTHAHQASSLLFEQDMLPRLFFRDEEIPPLRLTLCGMVWDGTTCYGQSLESLCALQRLLDTQWPDCLHRFDGDFSLCYLFLDGETVSLYRSLTCTRELYYYVTATDLTWSTSPIDLFGTHPTLEDVDQEMVAVMTATGLADPERSVYHQRRRLPPGKGIQFSPDGSSRAFQDDYIVHDDNTHLPYPQAVKRFRDYVEAAVVRAFHGSSECHLFVSGGLDTAVIAYEAARLGKEVHGYHWTWDLPMFQQEYQRAQAVAQWTHLHLHPINFQSSLEPGGNYITSMLGLPLPYNHAFYSCFRETVAAVVQQSSHEVSLLATGHLGDTLFQGDWADPFRPHSQHFPAILQTCRDIFSCYPRHQAWGVISYVLGNHRHDLQENFNTTRVFAHQSLFTPDAFQHVLKQGMVDYREQQSVAWQQQPFEKRLVAAALQSGIAFNAPLKTSILYRDALPQGVILRHPFANRQLHEFCLSLGPQHRSRWHGGQIYTKFLMRLAYIDALPPAIIQQEIRTPYAAISEHFCLRNRQQLMEIFDRNAILARWNILHIPQIQEILATPELCQKHSRSLVRMSGVEMWLQGLTPHPRLPSRPVSPCLITTSASQSHDDTGVVVLPFSIRAHLINGQCVLLNASTLHVSRLDEIGTRYWVALLAESSWADVIRRVTLPHESFLDIQPIISNFALALIRAKWIDMKQEYKETEVLHELSIHYRKPASDSTRDADTQ